MDEKIGTDQEGRELRLADILESEPVDVVENLEMQKNIRLLKEKLPKVLDEREKLVISERYGLLGKEEHTQREIAQQLGISRSYVSRIEKKALEKLREALITI